MAPHPLHCHCTALTNGMGHGEHRRAEHRIARAYYNGGGKHKDRDYNIRILIIRLQDLLCTLIRIRVHSDNFSSQGDAFTRLPNVASVMSISITY